MKILKRKRKQEKTFRNKGLISVQIAATTTVSSQAVCEYPMGKLLALRLQVSPGGIYPAMQPPLLGTTVSFHSSP